MQPKLGEKRAINKNGRTKIDASIIPNSVAGTQSDPLRNGLVGVLLDRKGALGSETLVRRL